MKIRIKFRKYGIMRFIGHLDMMRYFQKAMRRAGIDIAYSEGFSPHQIMSFAAPLGVGITSDGEYFDIEAYSTGSSKEALSALNEVMVEGVQVTEYRLLPEGTKNAMSSVAAADYSLHVKEGIRNPFTLKTLEDALHAFYEGQSEILITKQTKKSERTIDLKPLIYDLKAVDEADPGFFLKVCTGSTDNIKPELVLAAFFEYSEKNNMQNSGPESGFSLSPSDFVIHRLEVYAKDESGFVPLGALGEDIP